MSLTRESETKKCKICGKVFVPCFEGAGYKYCSVNCGEEAHKERDRKRQAKIRAEGGVIRKPKAKKKSNMDLINEIDDKAKAAGMSYGRYVLMLQMQEEAERRKKEKAKCSKVVNGVIVPESIINAQIKRRKR